jgi:hypothetical protein
MIIHRCRHSRNLAAAPFLPAVDPIGKSRGGASRYCGMTAVAIAARHSSCGIAPSVSPGPGRHMWRLKEDRDEHCRIVAAVGRPERQRPLEPFPQVSTATPPERSCMVGIEVVQGWNRLLTSAACTYLCGYCVSPFELINLAPNGVGGPGVEPADQRESETSPPQG